MVYQKQDVAVQYVMHVKLLKLEKGYVTITVWFKVGSKEWDRPWPLAKHACKYDCMYFR